MIFNVSVDNRFRDRLYDVNFQVKNHGRDVIEYNIIEIWSGVAFSITGVLVENIKAGMIGNIIYNPIFARTIMGGELNYALAKRFNTQVGYIEVD